MIVGINQYICLAILFKQLDYLFEGLVKNDLFV